MTRCMDCILVGNQLIFTEIRQNIWILIQLISHLCANLMKVRKFREENNNNKVRKN